MDSIKGWQLGVNNLADDGDIPSGALRDSVNTDITASGKPRRRAGMRQVIPDAGAHSVFGSSNFLIWATQNKLNVSRDMTKNTVMVDTRLSKPISYVEVNGTVYFSNEDVNGCILPDGTLTPWGLPTPDNSISLSAVTGNRIVQVTCAFVSSTGEVSGAPIGVSVACDDNPIITVNNIPQSADPRVTSVRLYATELDGRVFYECDQIPIGRTSTTVRGTPIGEPLMTQFMEPPPPGQLIDYADGVIFIASGNNVFHTDPLRYGLCNLRESFFIFSERVTLLKSVSGGLFVSADQTYYIPKAATPSAQLDTKYPYKAIEGAACNLPQSTDVMFFTDYGLVRGSNGGATQSITENRIGIDQYSRGCLGVNKREGEFHVVCILRDPIKNSLVSSDFRSIA